ncbi:hypothetical protein PFISCL1PPCAC_20923, partial [Pristionchus fissidentatus]
RPDSRLYIEAFKRIIKNVEFGRIHASFDFANSYHSKFIKNFAAITAETVMYEKCKRNIQADVFIDKDSLITSYETIHKLRAIAGCRDVDGSQFRFRISQVVAADILYGSMGVDFAHLLKTRDLVRTNDDIQLYGKVTSSGGKLCPRTQYFPRGVYIDWTFD